jgi:hypothetical protein
MRLISTAFFLPTLSTLRSSKSPETASPSSSSDCAFGTGNKLSINAGVGFLSNRLKAAYRGEDLKFLPDCDLKTASRWFSEYKKKSRRKSRFIRRTLADLEGFRAVEIARHNCREDPSQCTLFIAQAEDAIKALTFIRPKALSHALDLLKNLPSPQQPAKSKIAASLPLLNQSPISPCPIESMQNYLRTQIQLAVSNLPSYSFDEKCLNAADEASKKDDSLVEFVADARSLQSAQLVLKDPDVISCLSTNSPTGIAESVNCANVLTNKAVEPLDVLTKNRQSPIHSTLFGNLFSSKEVHSHEAVTKRLDGLLAEYSSRRKLCIEKIISVIAQNEAAQASESDAFKCPVESKTQRPEASALWSLRAEVRKMFESEIQNNLGRVLKNDAEYQLTTVYCKLNAASPELLKTAFTARLQLIETNLIRTDDEAKLGYATHLLALQPAEGVTPSAGQAIQRALQQTIASKQTEITAKLNMEELKDTLKDTDGFVKSVLENDLMILEALKKAEPVESV